MGKKTNPAAIRIDFNGWTNVAWFGTKKTYGQNIYEDHVIRTSVAKSFPNEVIGNVTIERSFGNCVVFLHTHRPGFLIGEKGINIEKLQEKIKTLIGKIVKINIVEIFKPEASAQLICDQLVQALINRSDYKRLAKSCVRFAMKSPSVKGISITIAGRLNGASIARVEKFKDGSVSLQTFRDKIIYVKKGAKTIFGICGVKVFVSYHSANSFNLGGKYVNAAKGS